MEETFSWNLFEDNAGGLFFSRPGRAGSTAEVVYLGQISGTEAAPISLDLGEGEAVKQGDWERLFRAGADHPRHVADLLGLDPPVIEERFEEGGASASAFLARCGQPPVCVECSTPARVVVEQVYSEEGPLMSSRILWVCPLHRGSELTREPASEGAEVAS
jgi:hypothetical protein